MPRSIYYWRLWTMKTNPLLRRLRGKDQKTYIKLIPNGLKTTFNPWKSTLEIFLFRFNINNLLKSKLTNIFVAEQLFIISLNKNK